MANNPRNNLPKLIDNPTIRDLGADVMQHILDFLTIPDSLATSIESRDFPMIRVLAGGDLRRVDETILEYTVQHGPAVVLRWILARGALPSADLFNEAAACGNIWPMPILRNAGGVPTEVALEMAHNHEMWNLVEYLLDHDYPMPAHWPAKYGPNPIRFSNGDLITAYSFQRRLNRDAARAAAHAAAAQAAAQGNNQP